MKFIIALILIGFGIINCSKLLNERENTITKKFDSIIKYDGRFSRIEPFPGYETVDADESINKCKNKITAILLIYLDNISISEPGASLGCDIICKLKAASLPVIVPSGECDESKIPSYDKYWLKMKLLKDLSELPAETFIQNQIVFDVTMAMIEYHLFYRIQEYKTFLQVIMETYPSIEDAPEHLVSERGWNLILKPVHVILNKIIRSNSKQVQAEAPFIAEIVQLISSPVEEESRMMSSLIAFVLFNSDSLTSRIVLSSINDFINKITSGEIPFIAIEPILRFIGDLMMSCSRRPDSKVTAKILEIVRTKILSLNGHLKFFWIQESFTNALIQYFIIFEVAEGMSIERSPFEPFFPDVSPFNDSKEVNIIRRALIRRSREEKCNICRLNQLAKFYSMFKLISYQFYPRAMLVDIFESVKIEFVDHLSIESASLFYALLTKTELFRLEDEVSEFARGSLLAMGEDIGRCRRHGHELGNICTLLAQQIKLILNNLINNPKIIETGNIKRIIIS